MAGGELFLAEMLALLGLDGIGVGQAFFNAAFAGAAQAPAAFEGDAAFLAQRDAQQVAVFRGFDGLVVVADKGDGGQKGAIRRRVVR